jgi:hypothetical protein
MVIFFVKNTAFSLSLVKNRMILIINIIIYFLVFQYLSTGQSKVKSFLTAFGITLLLNGVYSMHFSDKPYDGTAYSLGYAIGNSVSFTVAGFILGLILYFINFRPKFGATQKDDDDLIDLS